MARWVALSWIGQEVVPQCSGFCVFPTPATGTCLLRRKPLCHSVRLSMVLTILNLRKYWLFTIRVTKWVNFIVIRDEKGFCKIWKICYGKYEFLTTVIFFLAATTVSAFVFLLLPSPHPNFHLLWNALWNPCPCPYCPGRLLPFIFVLLWRITLLSCQSACKRTWLAFGFG